MYEPAWNRRPRSCPSGDGYCVVAVMVGLLLGSGSGDGGLGVDGDGHAPLLAGNLGGALLLRALRHRVAVGGAAVVLEPAELDREGGVLRGDSHLAALARRRPVQLVDGDVARRGGGVLEGRLDLGSGDEVHLAHNGAVGPCGDVEERVGLGVLERDQLGLLEAELGKPRLDLGGCFDKEGIEGIRV